MVGHLAGWKKVEGEVHDAKHTLKESELTEILFKKERSYLGMHSYSYILLISNGGTLPSNLACTSEQPLYSAQYLINRSLLTSISYKLI